jgi:DNA polymerase III subunit epsilon
MTPATNRVVVLDTETTGLEHNQGHRLIEIGCVELINRRPTGRHLHHYLNPQREIDAGAIEVHGITNEMLVDKPLFEHVVDELLEFVRGAELVIHNAPFDLGFINNELGLSGRDGVRVEALCTVTDTLIMARQRHPGQRNNLDALCQRYGVDNSQRELHGALLDAEILADVYLAMTGGQTALALATTDTQSGGNASTDVSIRRVAVAREQLRVIAANAVELEAHSAQLALIDKASGGKTLFRVESQ